MNPLTPISILPTLEPVNPLQGLSQKDNSLASTQKEKKAFQDFEKMFVHMMLKEMRKTLNASSMTEKSHATKMYEEMMDEAMADQMAASNQLGIAKDLFNQLESDRLRQKVQLSEATMRQNSIAPIKV